MKTALFWMAVTGWTLGLTVHLLSVFNIDVEDKVPFIWLLHFGIFLVWIPTVSMLKKTGELNTASSGPWSLFYTLRQKAPDWVAAIAIGGLIYAVINFLLFIYMQGGGGTPAVNNGHYYLHNHGTRIRDITEHEYYHYRALTVRGFSGHWMAFYGMAAAFLYPFKKGPQVAQ